MRRPIAVSLAVLLHLPLWLEIVVFVLALANVLWQERYEFKRLWLEVRTGERIESVDDIRKEK